MGILDRIRQNKEQRLAERLARVQNQKIMTMDARELWALTSDELVDSALIRMQGKTEGMTEEEALAHLNEIQRNIYILKVFDEEIQTGGMLQFFVNDSRDLAPFVSEALAAVRALPYTEFFDEFINKNGIDVRDLDSFKIDDISEYELNIGRYPFDDFDSAYYYENLKNPLERLLIVYARENLEHL